MMLLFDYSKMNEFNSKSFKLLWEKKQNINIDRMKELIQWRPELKNKMIVTVTDAVAYYR